MNIAAKAKGLFFSPRVSAPSPTRADGPTESDTRHSPNNAPEAAVPAAAKKDLEAAEHAAQLAVITKSMAVAEFELDGTLRQINDKFLLLLGYGSREMVGQNHDNLIHASYRDSAEYRGFWSALARGETRTATIKYQAQGGRALWLNSIHAPLLDEAGKPYKVVQYATDMTQQTLIVEQLQEAVHQTQDIVKQSIAGDLTVRIAAGSMSGEIAQMVNDVNALLNARMVLVGRVKSLTVEVRAASEEIAKGNDTLSRVTEGQAASLEETAASLEQMTSTVKITADNAAMASSLAAAARQQAETGGGVVTAAVAAMEQIRTSSNKIADIISVIDSIAFQTNLLALNAAVEAARAGDQGRGFAVVASEVRNLAGRSATAAKEIKSLIQDSVNKVQDGAKLVDESGRTLAGIVTSIKKVNDIAAEIAVATREQSAGIEQVNKAVMQIDEATQQNAALVEETASASQSIVDQMQALHTIVVKYRTESDSVPVARTKNVA